MTKPSDGAGDRGGSGPEGASRLRLEVGRHGLRFVAGRAKPLTVEEVRRLLEQGRR